MSIAFVNAIAFNLVPARAAYGDSTVLEGIPPLHLSGLIPIVRSGPAILAPLPWKIKGEPMRYDDT